MFSSLLRKLLQSFRCWGIVCPSFYLKILRSEMPLDICVMSFIRLLLYIPLIICIDAGYKCSWLVTASRKVSANSFQGKLIGLTRTTAMPSYIQSESVWNSFLADSNLLIKQILNGLSNFVGAFQKDHLIQREMLSVGNYIPLLVILINFCLLVILILLLIN